MLALAYPGTTPDYWEGQLADDRMIATAIDVLEARG